jgi:hypothetical protein
MRFVMLMIPHDYATVAPGTLPDAESVAKMMKYNETLQKAGVLLAIDGFSTPAEGARIRFGKDKPQVVDGPFTEAKEAIGGYWMIQAKSREEAIEWAKRCPASEGDLIEIRQVHELSDFPAEAQAVTDAYPEIKAKYGARKEA